jgi:hypothetical protein
VVAKGYANPQTVEVAINQPFGFGNRLVIRVGQRRELWIGHLGLISQGGSCLDF